MRDREGDAALRRAVELRQRDAADLDCLAEELRLADAVLPGGRVDDEQRLVWRAFEPVLDDTSDLRQLFHQVHLRVQAAGGVDDDDVPAARRSGFDGVVGDRRRVSSALRADEIGLRPAGPDLELLLGRRAERVRGRDDHRAAVFVQVVRELPDRRRLAGAVDSDDEQDARLLGERRACPARRASPWLPRRAPRSGLRPRLEPRAARRARPSPARRRRRRSTPPRAVPRPRRRPGSKAAAAS